MPGSITGKTQPSFAITESACKSVTANTDIDVTKISQIFFIDATTKDAVAVKLKVGSLTEAFPLEAGTVMQLDDTTSVVQIDINAFMFAMGR